MYFSIKEFFPNCSQQEINKVFSSPSLSHNLQLLMTSLDCLRRQFGSPIFITSGYRNPEHNESVGGVENSWHTFMCAVDIKPLSNSYEEMQRLVDLVDEYHHLFPEVVIHKGYIHLSIKD